MNADLAALLRAPFKEEEVGQLPRIFCTGCRRSESKVCDKHKKVRCSGCSNNITEAHLHLAYVGHAEITDRLLQVDPEWSWEPLAFTAVGLPQFDDNAGLWIRLTVAGVTRLGYGDAEGKKGPAAIKETIGDALRNAAMRFGTGLDLWGSKFDPPAANTGEEAEGVGGAISGDQREVLADLWGELGYAGDMQRGKRLSISAQLLGLQELSLFSSLNHEQAGTLIGRLRAKIDENAEKKATAERAAQNGGSAS